MKRNFNDKIAQMRDWYKQKRKMNNKKKRFVNESTIMYINEKIMLRVYVLVHHIHGYLLDYKISFWYAEIKNCQYQIIQQYI